MKSLFRVFFILGINMLVCTIGLNGQGLTLTYDTLKNKSVDFSRMKSNVPVASYTTRFGTVVTANMKLDVGSPVKSSGDFVSFLNDRVQGIKFSADGHKAISGGIDGNFLVIREMITWNPQLEEQLQAEANKGLVLPAQLDLTEELVPTEEELVLLKQNPLIIIAYATAPNGAEMTITDLARAIELGELKDPKVPEITEEMSRQLNKIDKMLERGEITKEKHMELQSQIMESGVKK